MINKRIYKKLAGWTANERQYFVMFITILLSRGLTGKNLTLKPKNNNPTVNKPTET